MEKMSGPQGGIFLTHTVIQGEHPEILAGIGLGRWGVEKKWHSAYKSSNISTMQQDRAKVTIKDQ